jgi:glycosyltransferase involved in cell wall biosynthesis
MNFKIKPENVEFVVLSFEGPDPYAMSGGLGTRVRGLSGNLAKLGYKTHLIFIGDPDMPGIEKRFDDKLTYYRWGQWLSSYYSDGVYDGEEEKVKDFNTSIPFYVTENIIKPAVENNKLVVIMAEEWHTAQAVINLSNYLHYIGLRDKVIMLWNANNIYSFHRINWGALNYVSHITTVSKYMKHQMWNYGINPTVIPNGIPDNFFNNVDSNKYNNFIQDCTGADITLFKVGRFSPDKRWHMAIQALSLLKKRGVKSSLLMKGGSEPFGGEVFHEINRLGLKSVNIHPRKNAVDSLVEDLSAAPRADIYNIIPFMQESMLKPLYADTSAVLANSGHEPFGLVGLEVMACKGISFLGSTGEDYAIPFKNSIVLETDEPEEIVSYVHLLHRNPQRNMEIRKMARSTAKCYSWKNIIQGNLLARLIYLKNNRP